MGTDKLKFLAIVENKSVNLNRIWDTKIDIKNVNRITSITVKISVTNFDEIGADILELYIKTQTILETIIKND